MNQKYIDVPCDSFGAAQINAEQKRSNVGLGCVCGTEACASGFSATSERAPRPFFFILLFVLFLGLR